MLVANSVTIRRTRRVLPPVARALTKKVATRLVPYRHKRMRISPERARQVRELLREDVDRLAAEWGVDVPLGIRQRNSPRHRLIVPPEASSRTEKI